VVAVLQALAAGGVGIRSIEHMRQCRLQQWWFLAGMSLTATGGYAGAHIACAGALW
jgi:hypothetical protein